jgi:hypothetical protein
LVLGDECKFAIRDSVAGGMRCGYYGDWPYLAFRAAGRLRETGWSLQSLQPALLSPRPALINLPLFAYLTSHCVGLILRDECQLAIHDFVADGMRRGY